MPGAAPVEAPPPPGAPPVPPGPAPPDCGDPPSADGELPPFSSLLHPATLVADTMAPSAKIAARMGGRIVCPVLGGNRLEIVTRPARRIELAQARKDPGREIGEFVTTATGTVHAIVRGQGADVVLIHGVTDNAHTWHDVQNALGGSARTHALDLPGHGFSDIPPAPLTAREMATWVLSYLDAARIERAVVVGWSLGGAVAAAFAADYASRVSGLVLEAPALLEFSFPVALWPLRLTGIGEIMHLIAARHSARRFFMASTFARGFSPSDEAVERYWRGWQVAERPRYIRALLREFDSNATTPLLGEIRAPAWLVHGDEDQLIPRRVADELETRLPGVRFSRLTKVGHAPHIERPDVVLDAIRAALGN
jgi:pimeloyl-ACP methyl ester carboxylesterase